MCYLHEYAENKNVFSECLKESLLVAGSLRLAGKKFHIAGPATRRSPPTITAETMARHDEKTSAGRAKSCLEATLETNWQRSTRY